MKIDERCGIFFCVEILFRSPCFFHQQTSRFTWLWLADVLIDHVIVIVAALKSIFSWWANCHFLTSRSTLKNDVSFYGYRSFDKTFLCVGILLPKMPIKSENLLSLFVLGKKGLFKWNFFNTNYSNLPTNIKFIDSFFLQPF